MSEGTGGSWTSMNENLMALLEAVLSLAASDSTVTRRPPRSTVKAGGYNQDIFLDLTDEEEDQFLCNICYQVLKETMQCVNHHKFCHSCLYVWSTTGQYANRVRCPVCRCQGYYFRDDELDDRISKKKVKCSMESCRWRGPLKHLAVHRHTNYGSTSQPLRLSLSGDQDDDDDEDEEEAEDASDVLELPYLSRAPPRLPNRSQSRFGGTGLQARTVMSTAGGVVRGGTEEGGRNPTVQTTTTRLDGTTTTTRLDGTTTTTRLDGTTTTTARLDSATGGGGGAGMAGRERLSGVSGTDSNSAAATPTPDRRLSVRQRVHPIRRRSVNRITVTHTDSNNNVAATSTTNTGSQATRTRRATARSPAASSETPRQPRPPSAPRPRHQSRPRRRLPRVSGTSQTPAPQSSSGGQTESPPTPRINRAPPTVNASPGDSGSPLGAFHNRLQESRERLEGLMSNFSGELERSRQEMADFQVERERQRREQLAEVRELGRRLGQVASELRHLLGHRRLHPSDSDQ